MKNNFDSKPCAAPSCTAILKRNIFRVTGSTLLSVQNDVSSLHRGPAHGLSFFLLFLLCTAGFAGSTAVSPGTDYFADPDAGMDPYEGRRLLHVGGGLDITRTGRLENDEIEVMPVKGFNLGADYEYILHRYFSVMPGISLETRGVHTVDNRTIEQVDRFMQSYYIQVPLMLKVSWPFFFDENRISLFGGPEAGLFLLRQAQIGGQSVDGDQLGRMHRFDFGFSAGISLELGAGPGAVVFSSGLYQGLFNHMEDQTLGARYRNVKIRGSYVFRLR